MKKMRLATILVSITGHFFQAMAQESFSCRDGRVVPRLFIIGAQKGGTSSLYAELASMSKGRLASSSCSTTQNDQKECNGFSTHTVLINCFPRIQSQCSLVFVIIAVLPSCDSRLILDRGRRLGYMQHSHVHPLVSIFVCTRADSCHYVPGVRRSFLPPGLHYRQLLQAPSGKKIPGTVVLFQSIRSMRYRQCCHDCCSCCY